MTPTLANKFVDLVTRQSRPTNNTSKKYQTPYRHASNGRLRHEVYCYWSDVKRCNEREILTSDTLTTSDCASNNKVRLTRVGGHCPCKSFLTLKLDLRLVHKQSPGHLTHCTCAWPELYSPVISPHALVTRSICLCLLLTVLTETLTTLTSSNFFLSMKDGFTIYVVTQSSS